MIAPLPIPNMMTESETAMSLSNLEQHVLAYFVSEYAAEFTITDRFYPHGELVLVWADKISVATRKFGRKLGARAKPVATELLDMMIEKGGYSSKTNDFGGTMHAFKPDEYQRIIREMKESDPIILKAKAAGPEFWANTFEQLTS